MFDNPILEWGRASTRPSRRSSILPVIGFLLVRAVGHENLAIGSVAGVFVLGVLAWSLTEYLLHRFIFHLEPDSRWGRRVHFIIHGVHHDFPHDPMRLVMPPSVSIPLALLFWLGFDALLGPAWALPAFAGSCSATSCTTWPTTTCTTTAPRTA